MPTDLNRATDTYPEGPLRVSPKKEEKEEQKRKGLNVNRAIEFWAYCFPQSKVRKVLNVDQMRRIFLHLGG
jgi:hypothetical protein